MSIQAHSATLDLSPQGLSISYTQLAKSLGCPATREIALDDIGEITAVQPTSTAFGFVRLSGVEEVIYFAPNQDALSCAELIRQVKAGEVSSTSDKLGLDFTAVDVETANDNWGSICQIGAVKFRNGVETEAKTWLCTPPPGLEDFAEVNISIHGITADIVADAAPFAEVAEEFFAFAGEDVLVAHNAQFDSTALRSALLTAKAHIPTATFACSLALARHASRTGLLSVANHKLPTVAKALGCADFRHHDACEDARAAGLIIAGLAKTGGSIEELFSDRGFTLGKLRPEHISPVLRSGTAPISGADIGAGTDFREPARRPWSAVATPDSVPEPAEDADPNNPLYGQHVTLTGDFEPFDKGEIWQAIAERGGRIGKNVTKKTTILVLGTWATKTSKEKRAEGLNEKGQGIEMWPSSELFKVLELEEQPPF